MEYSNIEKIKECKKCKKKQIIKLSLGFVAIVCPNGCEVYEKSRVKKDKPNNEPVEVENNLKIMLDKKEKEV